jgi:ParB-like chromosome segregation protein Spo0J
VTRDGRTVADRLDHCREPTRHGDLAGLAESIRSEGLLQPIGINENRELVFGEWRLRACRDVLGWTEIDVRPVDVTSIAAGELHENEVRKNFTASERVAILKLAPLCT